MRNGMKKGTYKDAATTEDNGEVLLKNNAGFSYFIEGELGGNCQGGSDRYACDPALSDSYTSADDLKLYKFVWAVPHNATEPEAAVKFLNMMYTDSCIENLLLWGIEGEITRLKTASPVLLNGEDINTVAYHMADHMFENQFFALPEMWQPKQRILGTGQRGNGSGRSRSISAFPATHQPFKNELTALTM